MVSMVIVSVDVVFFDMNLGFPASRYPVCAVCVCSCDWIPLVVRALFILWLSSHSLLAAVFWKKPDFSPWCFCIEWGRIMKILVSWPSGFVFFSEGRIELHQRAVMGLVDASPCQRLGPLGLWTFWVVPWWTSKWYQSLKRLASRAGASMFRVLGCVLGFCVEEFRLCLRLLWVCSFFWTAAFLANAQP